MNRGDIVEPRWLAMFTFGIVLSLIQEVMALE